ncbi:AraC family transcriptional regulator [Caulobacter sp. 602-2]|uniref:AraC family transcriptional regulator n=1 Tax=Caulobacter sp. 602-2 TaxID=2710887 RepID=A0A6G4QU05_9CAUL|nr:helix-turn-helix transcriptional regulator [Caulobacter sp. 602-2]NGM48438.1 AraC family transcriptional regulator [Caulobacter sp. 602-2]
MPDQGRIDGDRPLPVSFRTERFHSGTAFPRKRQPWAELNYALSGVCEIEVAGTRYLSPPAYGIWIPPQVEHEAWNREEMTYVTVYVDAALCGSLPASVRTIALSPLLKAILADFAARGVTSPKSAEDQRLALVLVDQIGLAPRYDTYLPVTDDPLVARVVAALDANPQDRRSLAEWARMAEVTERTLSRRWREATGITFNEWRQRQKLVVGLSLLKSGLQVQQVAIRLGYNDASAFIAMFRRLTGYSPKSISNF